VEPILSRQEIADLLSAIKKGQVTTEAAMPEQSAKFTNAESVNLLQMANKNSCQLRIPNFDIILDTFADKMGNSTQVQILHSRRPE
jgi:flagellar motor switch protein FliM